MNNSPIVEIKLGIDFFAASLNWWKPEPEFFPFPAEFNFGLKNLWPEIFKIFSRALIWDENKKNFNR